MLEPEFAELAAERYKLVFENDRVRDFDYVDKPGDITRIHHHKNFILYA